MISQSEKEIIHEIEKKTGLEFLEEEPAGNICYVHNNSDLQDEFKSGFTILEFRYFILSFLNKEVQIPDDALTFWKRVKKGRGLS